MNIRAGCERQETVLGYFAARCPQCAADAAHLAKQYHERPTIAFGAAAVAYRGWSLIGNYARCETCGHIRLIDPDDYTFTADPPADPHSSECRDGAIDARTASMTEVFLRHNSALSRYIAEDAWDMLTAALYAAAAIALLGLATALPDPLFGTMVAGACFGAGLYRRLTHLPRFARHVLLPRLAEDLKSLRPSSEELSAVFAKLRRMGARVAHLLSPADILRVTIE